MADNLTKQLIETVKNKVPLTGGLSIKGYPVMGTLSDMKNFKIEEGVLKLRYGTKKIASFDNKRFYFLKNFEFCGAEVLFGLDYQLCLHAFFENYEGYDFIVRDASQWHKNEMQLQQNQLVIGKDENDHYIISDPWTLGKLFNNGTQFWAYENQKYIMFFNDCGEIRVIVKDGGFKIHKDEQYIEVDIKDATNRVFDVPPALKDDTRNVAPRITGEYRFARVNELGVISELTEPKYLQNWQSKFAARIPVQTFQQQDLEIVTSSKSPDGEHKYIYYDSNGNLELAGSSWVKPEFNYDLEYEVQYMVLVVTQPATAMTAISKTRYGGDSVIGTTTVDDDKFSKWTIEKGIYLIPVCEAGCYQTLSEVYYFPAIAAGVIPDFAPPDNNPNNDLLRFYDFWDKVIPVTLNCSTKQQFFELELSSRSLPQFGVHKNSALDIKKIVTRIVDENEYPAPLFHPYWLKNLEKQIFDRACGRVRLAAGFNYRAVDDTKTGCYARDAIFKKAAGDTAYNFNEEIYNQNITKNVLRNKMMSSTHFYNTYWFTLEDNDVLYKDAADEHFTLSISLYEKPDFDDWDETTPIYNTATQFVVSGCGKLYNVKNFRQKMSFSREGDKIIKDFSLDCCAYRYKSVTDSVYDSLYKMDSMDTLKYVRAATNVVDLESQTPNASFNSSTGTLDFLMDGSNFMANKSDVENISDRFAIWNNNKILGISQRLFVDKNSPGVPVYLDNNINPENLLVRYSPVLSLEFMNQRSFRFELPLIRRAIRKPQFLCVSNNYVYEFEDNRLWYGSAYDFMLTGYTYLDGSLLKLIAYNEGVLACTTSGLYYVNRETVQPVVNGRAIRADFAGETQVGGIVIAENKVYVVKTEITDSGARIETANLISEPINELVFNGTIKLTCNKRQLYLADDYNVYGFDTRAGIWNLRYNYGNKRIADIFILDNRLGILFDNEVDAAKANTEYSEPILPS